MRGVGATEMTRLGIVQHPDPVLTSATTPYDLPAEADQARAVFAQLRAIAALVFALHPTEKGLGVAAPQVGVGRRIAILRPFHGAEICLLNATITSASAETDVRYEGCLSLFDVRGRVSRPLEVTVRAQDFGGAVWECSYANAAARLICHELDHLDGRLYPDRMAKDADVIPIELYRTLPGTDWTYP